MPACLNWSYPSFSPFPLPNTFYQIESNSQICFMYFILFLLLSLFFPLIKLQNSPPSLTEPDGWRKTKPSISWSWSKVNNSNLTTYVRDGSSFFAPKSRKTIFTPKHSSDGKVVGCGIESEIWWDQLDGCRSWPNQQITKQALVCNSLEFCEIFDRFSLPSSRCSVYISKLGTFFSFIIFLLYSGSKRPWFQREVHSARYRWHIGGRVWGPTVSIIYPKWHNILNRGMLLTDEITVCNISNVTLEQATSTPL